MDQFLAPETDIKHQFLDPEADKKCQFLDGHPETDVMDQFLDPETDIMGEGNYILQNIYTYVMKYGISKAKTKKIFQIMKVF